MNTQTNCNRLKVPFGNLVIYILSNGFFDIGSYQSYSSEPDPVEIPGKSIPDQNYYQPATSPHDVMGKNTITEIIPDRTASASLY